ncbi:MAG TPA: cell division protein FtsZ, partial [Rhizomicrobium sp.]
MAINLKVPEMKELRPRITVLGVGGAGGNAVNNMIESGLEGVDFVVANTDAQALAQSQCSRRIQLGAGTTEGLGAGAQPEVGRAGAEESLNEIMDQLAGSHMVFIAAGMGGGTGTGAAPVIARAVREAGILTVGVVTKPFALEGDRRMRVAEKGIAELQQFVHTLIVIPNQNLFRVANDRTTMAQAFAMADEVLHAGVRGVTDLIVMPGLINLDFADIKSVISEMGKAMMGTGEAEGEDRAARAVREQGILTVGVVTKPFAFEGDKRMRAAERGIAELQSHVHTLIVIPNQNLFRVANDRTTFAQAFAMADEVLHAGVRGVTDLIVMPGLINLDFADIKSVISEMGKAMMGTGEAEGEDRAMRAADMAISNPLLDDVSMKGAKGVLINITGGPDLML